MSEGASLDGTCLLGMSKSSSAYGPIMPEVSLSAFGEASQPGTDEGVERESWLMVLESSN